ncbi:MAG: hypothetical protein JEY99_05745 [Spirochaetales bacterium]|nr:hypothetical protein [Spirochaetales bacterium]
MKSFASYALLILCILIFSTCRSLPPGSGDGDDFSDGSGVSAEISRDDSDEKVAAGDDSPESRENVAGDDRSAALDRDTQISGENKSMSERDTTGRNRDRIDINAVHRQKETLLAYLAPHVPPYRLIQYLLEKIESAGGVIVVNGDIGTLSSDPVNVKMVPGCNLRIMGPSLPLNGPVPPLSGVGKDDGSGSGEIAGRLLTGLSGSTFGYNGIDLKQRIILVDLEDKLPLWEYGVIDQAREWGAGALVFMNSGGRFIPDADYGIPVFTCELSPPILRPGEPPSAYNCLIVPSSSYEINAAESPVVNTARIEGYFYSGPAIGSNRGFPDEASGEDGALVIRLGPPRDAVSWADKTALLLEAGRMVSDGDQYPPLFFSFQLSSEARPLGTNFPFTSGFSEEEEAGAGALTPMKFRIERAGSYLVPADWNSYTGLQFIHPDFGGVRVSGKFFPESLNRYLQYPRMIFDFSAELDLLKECYDSLGEENSSSENGRKASELKSILSQAFKRDEANGSASTSSVVSAQEFATLQSLFSISGLYPELVRRIELLDKAMALLLRQEGAAALNEALYRIEGGEVASYFSPETVKRAGLMAPAVLSELILSLELKRSIQSDFEGEIMELRFWIKQYEALIGQVLDQGLSIFE